MQKILHHGKKAYLLDSEDLTNLCGNGRVSHSKFLRLKGKLLSAKIDGIEYILITTSFKLEFLPVWVKAILGSNMNEIHCYRWLI